MRLAIIEKFVFDLFIFADRVQYNFIFDNTKNYVIVKINYKGKCV